MNQENIIKLAVLQAQKVESRYNNNFRLGSVLFSKNKIINVGRNYPNRTHPKSTTLFQKVHAEFDCVWGVPRNYLYKSDLLVVRIGTKNNLTMSKPCKYCMELLFNCKIRNVFWSNEVGNIESLRLN